MDMYPKTSGSKRLQDAGGITYAKYPDKGCDVSPSCLTCSLPSCKYDDPKAYLKWMRAKQRAPVQAALDSKSVAEVAKQFRLTERTIFRIKAKIKGGSQ